MLLDELKDMLSKLDDDNEMENWMINAIESRIKNDDYELEELLEYDNEDEVYCSLEEQYIELQPEEEDKGY